MKTMTKGFSVHTPVTAGVQYKTLRGMIMSPRRWTHYAMAALLAAAPAAAQKPAAVEIGGFGQWTFFDENAGRVNATPENGLGYGGRLGVFLTRNWQVEADGYYSPQSRELTEEFCCLGLFPDDVNASAFALRLNYNVPLGVAARSHLILGGGAVRTKYAFEGGNGDAGSTSSYGASGLAGLRVRLAGPVALRLDGVVDYMPSHEPDANLNTHLRAGLSLLLGGAAPALSMAIPAPTPAPVPPRPAPAPAPAPPVPVENAVTVCVIDPSQPYGIRMQDALYRVQQGDTVVMQSGERVALSQVAGNALVVRDAAWFTRGQPIDMMVGRDRTQYLAYQTARSIDPARLAYLGTIDGYPVYADRDRVASVNSALRDARTANANHDLGTILAARHDLHAAVEALPLLYLPMQRTNCIFQPMQMLQQVIKGR